MHKHLLEWLICIINSSLASNFIKVSSLKSKGEELFCPKEARLVTIVLGWSPGYQCLWSFHSKRTSNPFGEAYSAKAPRIIINGPRLSSLFFKWFLFLLSALDNKSFRNSSFFRFCSVQKKLLLSTISLSWQKKMVNCKGSGKTNRNHTRCLGRSDFQSIVPDFAAARNCFALDISVEYFIGLLL